LRRAFSALVLFLDAYLGLHRPSQQADWVRFRPRLVRIIIYGDSDSSSPNDATCFWRLFFAEDFEGFLAEDAVAGDPAGDDGEGRGDGDGGEVEGDLGLEGEVHGGAGFECPGDEVGEEDADGAGDEAEDGELDGEDGGDAGAGGAEGLEDDDLADAAVLGAGDGGREDDDAGEDGERGEELDDVGDLETTERTLSTTSATLMMVTVG
jgi:hypothetical protein